MGACGSEFIRELMSKLRPKGQIRISQMIVNERGGGGRCDTPGEESSANPWLRRRLSA